METKLNELGIITFIKYGVANVQLLPSTQRINVIVPTQANLRVGGVYGLKLDRDQEVAFDL